MAILTVYPSLDGYVYQRYDVGSGVDWATIIAAAGSGYNSTSSQSSVAYLVADSVASKWRELLRAIHLFDTSGLPDAVPILSAIFSVYGYQKADTGNIAPSTNVYSSNPISDSALEAADFARLGSVPLCDTPIAYADWNTSGFNNFLLNAAGLAAISKIGLTKLGLRNANYDVAATQPPWPGAAGVRATFVEQGDPYRPKLVITYTAPAMGRSQAHIIG